MHDCYLPTDSMSHGAHGVSPARVQQRARESLASERAVSSTAGDRQAPPPSSVSRHVSTTTEKYVLLLPFLSHVFVILWIKSFISSRFFALQCISGCVRTAFSFSLSFPGAPLAAPFFAARSRLPPPAESFFQRWLPEGQPQFSPPGPHFPNRHAQFSPLLRARASPSHPRFVLGLGAQRTEPFASGAPCRSGRIGCFLLASESRRPCLSRKSSTCQRSTGLTAMPPQTYTRVDARG
jgi:hypothetical protein